MQLRPVFIRCRRRIVNGVRSAGEKAHLIYFGSVAYFAHDLYAYAAGGCLVLGVAAELLGEAGDA